jgi:type I restriction enzyme S subunit
VDVKDGLILKDQVCHTSEEIESKYVRSRLQENDIIISIRGHVGRICIVPKDFQGANITQDTARLDLKNALSPEFAESCFNSAEFQRYINRYVKGAGVKGINLGDLKNLTVPVPTRKFQDQFSNQAKNIKTQKAQAKASLDKAEELFNSLLQRAFKGELT